MVLVDTSVWVHHFRYGNETLKALLNADAVLTHPMVLLEISCGTPPNRTETLKSLGFLQQAHSAGFSEVTAFVEREQLFGKGCGLVDLVLLASTLITPGAQLWTRDKRLSELSSRFGLDYQPLPH
jgi:predicted nucleic acid-binding protein